MISLKTGMHYPIDLDQLPTIWEKGYVGDFAIEIQPGFASGKHNKEGRGIPHIRPYNINRLGTLDLSEIKSVASDADTKRLHSGDVLFNNTNSPELIGKTAIVTNAGDWGFSNHMTRVVFHDTISPKFAAYQLHYLWMRGYFLHNCVKHVNQASVSSKTLSRAVPFVKPPRSQQDHIVTEIEKQFSRLDEAVANLKRVKANLKRYKAAVLKAAVEGKLTEAWRKAHPDVEPATKLLERILTNRRAKWKGKGKYKEPAAPNTTGLPKLPEGWTWASTDQIAKKITDGEHLSPAPLPTGVPLLSAKDVRDFGVIFDDAKYVSESDATKFRMRCAPEPGDILIVSRGATIGRACRVNVNREFCLMGSVILLKLHQLVESNYALSALKAGFFLTRLISLSGSTAQQAIYIRDIRPLPFPLPPLNEQIRIDAEVERSLSVIEELEATVEANLTRTNRLRQSILLQAFNGRIGKMASSSGRQG